MSSRFDALSSPLRVMTWNVRSLRDDRDAVVRVIRAFAPDVVLLQEAPRFLRARSKLAALARRSELVVAEGAGVEVAVLTSMRVDVSGGRTVQLSSTQGLHKRWAAFAELEIQLTTVTAVSVHLGLNGAQRVRHAAQVRDLLYEVGGGEVVIGADLNEESSASAWGVLGHSLADAGEGANAATFPAKLPQQRIDALFVPASWATRVVTADEVGCDAELIPASDHRPVVVDVVG